MKQKITFILIGAFFTVSIAFLYSEYCKKDKIENPKDEILLRKIGHDVLISSNDKTSKIVPIKVISDNEFQIRFENKFAFVPDSIINIVQRNISRSTFPKEYTVSVQKCSNEAIVYGFHIVSDPSKNVITCKGRKMPLDCYTITLKFASRTNSNTSTNIYLFLVAQFLAFLLFFLIRSILTKRKKERIIADDEAAIPIGKYIFYFKQHHLLFEKEKTSLTQKESKLLHILSSSPNETIDRNTLQREIWENEGVIVTRSLDMFISKLRKKLEKDSSIAIVNVHGVGYKLEINN